MSKRVLADVAAPQQPGRAGGPKAASRVFISQPVEKPKLLSIGNLRRRDTRAGYTRAVEYEWDPEKDRINQRLHGVSFAEASTVFLDPLAATVPDERFAVDEFRFRTTGYTQLNRLVIVAHTDRSDRVRMFSTREVTAR